MNDEELKKYYDGIAASWRFMRYFLTHGDPDQQSYWDQVISGADQIASKFQNKFITKMLIEAVEELERVSTQKQTSVRTAEQI